MPAIIVCIIQTIERAFFMKKENRKMAQERRAQQREAEVRKQKAKKVIPIVIVIAVIAVVVIGIIATSGLFGGKKADGSSVSSSSGDIVTTINTDSTGNAAGTGDTTAASSDSSASTGTTSQDTASAGASSSATSSSKGTLNTTEGTVVQKGDTVNIDYTGYLNGKAFDGGSTNGAGTDLTLGSGTYIDGFEDQVEGHKVGETFDIQVTFPEDYGVSDLNGQEVTFTVTINGVYQ